MINMKALLNPTKGNYGINYLPEFTEDFKKLIEAAIEKIKPFSNVEISRTVYYFEIKGNDVSSEFDCCDDEKCIKKAKIAIRKQYGKGTHINEIYYDNDGDHEMIEVCSVCGKPLNEWLTWCEMELKYLEENKWTPDFLKNEGFLINSILNSSPTMDSNISDYAKHQRGDILIQELNDREQFFQRIGELAKSVVEL